MIDIWGSGLRIKRAIEKYGIENFIKTILFECSSKEEMNKKEAEIVNEDFIARDDVYNIKLGGEGGWDEVNKNHQNIGLKYVNEHGLNNKSNQCYIAANKILNDSEYAIKFSEKIRKGIQKAKELNPEKFDKSGKKNPMYGHVYSNETLKKMSESHSGNKNSNFGKMWICNDETFESKTIYKSEKIPFGWKRGRFCKKHKK